VDDHWIDLDGFEKGTIRGRHRLRMFASGESMKLPHVSRRNVAPLISGCRQRLPATLRLAIQVLHYPQRCRIAHFTFVEVHVFLGEVGGVDHGAMLAEMRSMWRSNSFGATAAQKLVETRLVADRAEAPEDLPASGAL